MGEVIANRYASNHTSGGADGIPAALQWYGELEVPTRGISFAIVKVPWCDLRLSFQVAKPNLS